MPSKKSGGAYLLYRRSEKENALYFRLGRVTADEEAYARSSIGDVFYVIVSGAKRAPMLAYNTKYFEIDI